ncbi:hypothetical protein ACR79T_10225 [Sphingobacterium spiritivorum]|uniref:hypothetical protein n=1 Tax=Sphingobacterium spiritivorum TaxID=258 RepID=UPI003DA593D0
MSEKSLFIRHILKEEGKRLRSNQGRAIAKELKFHTNRLINDRVVNVLSQPQEGGTLRFTFPAYARVLDMKRERLKKRGKGKTMKSYRIYNRFVMGTYYSIAFRVANDFTDEMRRNIRNQFSGRVR